MNSQAITEQYTAREYYNKLVSEGEHPTQAANIVNSLFGSK